jgi:hypothetical protein
MIVGGTGVRQTVRLAVAGLALMFSSAPSAIAACPFWKVPSPFVAIQGNGIWVTFDLKQDGAKIWGKGGYQTSRKAPIGPTETTLVIGNAGGTIEGDRLYLRVFWTYSGRSSVGIYRGRIDGGYIVEGNTYDQMSKSPVSVEWHTDTPFACTDMAVAALPTPEPAPAPKKFIKSIGKSKPAPALPTAIFTGKWRVVANGGAWSYDMSLTQDGGTVAGSYVVVGTGGRGNITGRLDGNTLNFTWVDATGYAGTGRLTLPDGGGSFDGTYQVTFIPEGLTADLLQGTWRGQRQ